MVAGTTFPKIDEFFLSERLAESRRIIQAVAERSAKPLVLQFSGGKDSMVMVSLVQEVTDSFVCAYMCSGLEFPGTLDFVSETCERFGLPLVVSYPKMHKGDFFQRLEQFRVWPGLGGWGDKGSGTRNWCTRDLKLRPEKKLLHRLFGKGEFFKLEGIRRWESMRRRVIYKPYSDNPIRPDGEHKGSFEVFPIINWTNADVVNYLEMKGLPTEGGYKRYGVSGCAWCPFYPSSLYYDIIKKMPNHYDRWIEWEERLNQPSVMGGVWLRDIKRAVLEGKPLPEPIKKGQVKSPCMIEWEGEMIPTCTVYGHLYIDGECYRCKVRQVAT